MGADVGAIDTEIDARIERVLGDLKKAPEEVRVEPSGGSIGDEIDVVGKAVEHLLDQLVPADVIDQFLVGAVLGHLPREKLVEGNPADVETGKSIGVVGARFGKEFVAGQELRRRRFVRIVEGAIRSEERRVGKECRSRWSPYH